MRWTILPAAFLAATALALAMPVDAAADGRKRKVVRPAPAPSLTWRRPRPVREDGTTLGLRNIYGVTGPLAQRFFTLHSMQVQDR